MKKKICFIALGLLAELIVACTPQKQPIPKAQLKKLLDSVANAKTLEITNETKEDLDKRRAIEVKPLVDSFLNKNTTQNDTLSL